MNRQAITAWRVILGAACFFLYEFFQINMFNVLEAPMAAEFHASAHHMGWVSSSYFYGTMLLIFPAGLLLDRFSTRRIILWAVFATIAGAALFASAESLKGAALGRFVIGFCAGPFALISALKLATKWFPSHRLSLVTGTIVAIGMLGGIIAQTPLHTYVQAHGWRGASWLNAQAGVVLWVILFFALKDAPGHDVRSVKPDNPYSAAERIRMVLSQADNWRIAFFAGLTNLPIFLLGSLFSSLFLMEYHGIASAKAANLTQAIFFGMMVGCPLFGVLSIRWRSRKRPMLLGGATAFTMLFLLLMMQSTPWSIALAYFLMGFGASAHTLAYPYLAENNSSHVTASAESMAGVFIMLCAAVSQPLFGWILERSSQMVADNSLPVHTASGFINAVSMIPAALALGFVLVLSARETYPKASA